MVAEANLRAGDRRCKQEGPLAQWLILSASHLLLHSCQHRVGLLKLGIGSRKLQALGLNLRAARCVLLCQECKAR